MTPTRRSLTALSATAAMAALVLGPLQSTAQTTPAKPVAAPPSIVIPQAPPAKAAPKSLGGKPGVGKMLTREELRTCLARLDAVNTSTKDLEQRRAALDGEKEGLVKSGEALKTDRADVEVRLSAVREWELRMRAYGAEIEAFNQRLKAAEAAPSDQRETLAKELEAERERLNKAREPLAEEEARLVPAYQSAVKSYNEKAQARDAAVEDWNGRNKAFNEQGLKHDDERSTWLTECANRPYREDDEIAIKAGK